MCVTVRLNTLLNSYSGVMVCGVVFETDLLIFSASCMHLCIYFDVDVDGETCAGGRLSRF